MSPFCVSALLREAAAAQRDVLRSEHSKGALMRRTLLFCSILLTFAPATAFAESAVVVSATGGLFAPGTVVDLGRQITLSDGERVKFVTEGGDGIALKGPYVGSPSQIPAGSPLRTPWAALFPQGGGVGADAPSDPWAVDFDRDRDGKACVKEGQYISFHRGAGAPDTGFAVRSAGNWHNDARWSPGERDKTIGTSYPLRVDGDYTVARDDGATVTLVVISDSLPTDRMRAAYLNLIGCGAQAKLFAARAP